MDLRLSVHIIIRNVFTFAIAQLPDSQFALSRPDINFDFASSQIEILYGLLAAVDCAQDAMQRT